VLLLLDKDTRACEFEFLSQLLRRVPIRRLLPSEDPARSDELCAVIFGSYEAFKT
jgi:hypothetical protein